jgi:hypothetical protein
VTRENRLVIVRIDDHDLAYLITDSGDSLGHLVEVPGHRHDDFGRGMANLENDLIDELLKIPNGTAPR